jgi:hypothetical protein
VNVQAWPTGEWEREGRSVYGRELTAVRVPAPRLVEPLTLSFDQVLERLAALPRLFIEPDGSFVWVGGQVGEDGWQIDGQLHDSAQGLMSIELKLAGLAPDWRSIARCAGWPAQRLLFHLVEHGAVLDDDAWQSLGG